MFYLKSILVLIFLFFLANCRSSLFPEKSIINCELGSLIIKSSESISEYRLKLGKYHRVYRDNSVEEERLVSSVFEGEKNFMYLIKRTPASVAQISKKEREALRGFLEGARVPTIVIDCFSVEDKEIIIFLQLDEKLNLTQY